MNNPIKFTDPTGNGTEGDIYSRTGVHLGTDGRDDNRVFISDGNEQLTEDQASFLIDGHDFLGTWGNVQNGAGLTELFVGHDAFQLLAAIAYGEGSTANNSNEMYGIASAVVNNNNVRGANANLSNTITEIANASNDGNARFTAFTNASLGDRNNSGGMTTANAAAVNALTGGRDYSNGATGWDGRDLINLNRDGSFANGHRYGLNIPNAAHDIHNAGDRPLTRRENGSLYRRQVTAAHGQTMFMRIHPTYVRGGGRAF
jgi:hypothetical protein